MPMAGRVDAPLRPAALARDVLGQLCGEEELRLLDVQGSEIRYAIHRYLGADRSWTGERILDY
jgi:hypothetical protein